MSHYKIIIAYDGTGYYGWQVLAGLPTIAQTLQDLFKQVFDHQIILRGVSRTDAGVHAVGQVATFKTELDLDAEKIKLAWNNLLPSSMLIRSCEKVSDDFNLHANVAQKTYMYHFFTSRPLPFGGRFGWYFRYPVDFDKLEQCLNIFVGTHDFRSFCTGDDAEFKLGTVRTIDAVCVEYIKRFGVFRITIKGHSFLRHMIRRIVGACLQVASSPELEVQAVRDALAEKKAEQALLNAPAHGLVLYRVRYKN